MPRSTKYWVIVASKDHVRSGMRQGIAQACHGKVGPLKRMKQGDYVVFYSGKQTMGSPEKCQQFTAIGQVRDEDIYPFPMTADFCPFRRNIEFMEHDDVSILPLINELDFIPNKKSWGYPFRFGFFEIDRHDFDLISTSMLRKQYGEKDRIPV